MISSLKPDPHFHRKYNAWTIIILLDIIGQLKEVFKYCGSDKSWSTMASVFYKFDRT